MMYKNNKVWKNKLKVGYYMIPISFASFIGTLIFGPLFDTIGRRKMIVFTCIFL